MKASALPLFPSAQILAAYLLAGVATPGGLHAAAISFEEGEGFAPGTDIAARAAWKQSAAGAAKITAAEAQYGRQSLEISASPGEAAATTSFPIPDDGIVFLDFAIRPTADDSKTPLSTIDANGAMLGFLKAGGEGRVVALTAPGDKTAAANVVDAAHPFTVDEQNIATDWMRITIRENLKAGKWDLYVDGRLALIDQPLLGKAQPKKGALSFEASPAGPAYTDDLTITTANPLFADADKDGIPDAVEMVEGTNPYYDDRDADLNGDGKSNARNFLAGASIGTPRTSKNAARRVIYVDGRHGDDRFSGGSSYALGAPAKGGDGPKASLPAAIRSADEQTSFVLLPSDKPYQIIERAPGSKDTLYLIPLGDISITTEKP